MLRGEYLTLLSNHSTMRHSALALRYLKRAIKAYEAQGRKEDLAWAYLWQSSLFMRRSLPAKAEEALKRARELFPQSFLVKSAQKRLKDGLPWM